MEFKVKDVVKLIKKINSTFKAGDVATISDINIGASYPYHIKNINGIKIFVKSDEIILDNTYALEQALDIALNR